MAKQTTYDQSIFMQPQSFGFCEHTIDDDEDNILTTPCLLYVGTAGDVKVKMASGHNLLIKNFENNHAVRVIKVYSTDTTATDIILFT